MFVAVRRASAMTDTMGFTPEQQGIPLASAIQTPVVSYSSPFGFATQVCGSLPNLALHIRLAQLLRVVASCNLAITWSMLKLADFCRCGNSTNVSSICAT